MIFSLCKVSYYKSPSRTYYELTDVNLVGSYGGSNIESDIVRKNFFVKTTKKC